MKVKNRFHCREDIRGREKKARNNILLTSRGERNELHVAVIKLFFCELVLF